MKQNLFLDILFKKDGYYPIRPEPFFEFFLINLLNTRAAASPAAKHMRFIMPDSGFGRDTGIIGIVVAATMPIIIWLIIV